jgi:hypothetical protein
MNIKDEIDKLASKCVGRPVSVNVRESNRQQIRGLLVIFSHYASGRQEPLTVGHVAKRAGVTRRWGTATERSIQRVCENNQNLFEIQRSIDDILTGRLSYNTISIKVEK